MSIKPIISFRVDSIIKKEIINKARKKNMNISELLLFLWVKNGRDL